MIAVKAIIYLKKIIPNIWWKNGGKIFKNKPRLLIEDLDSLPFPDKDIFDYIPPERYQLFASRGCPYVCSYCFNHSYTKFKGDKIEGSDFQELYLAPGIQLKGPYKINAAILIGLTEDSNKLGMIISTDF